MKAKFIRPILILLVFLISNCSQNPGGEITGITAPAPTPPQKANTVKKIEKKCVEISATSLKKRQRASCESCFSFKFTVDAGAERRFAANGFGEEKSCADDFESKGVFRMQTGASSGDNGVWIVTGRAIYKMADGKIANCSPLPQKFENVDGIAVNESGSGVILIGTDINRAKSLSGVTSLIAVKH